MTDIDIAAIRQRAGNYAKTPIGSHRTILAIALANEDVPALLAKVDELTAERDEYAADNTRVVAQLVAANRHADGLEADLRSANTANTAYANENARLRSQLADTDKTAVAR